MKRSDFFKSLAGIAVAPIVGVKVLSEISENPWTELLANSKTVTAEVTPMPFYPQGTIQTAWLIVDEDDKVLFSNDPYFK